MKLINSILFYFSAVVAMVMILNDDFNRFNILGFIILCYLAICLKAYDKDYWTELLGIDWLQEKFKNNPVIMDMTKE